MKRTIKSLPLVAAGLTVLFLSGKIVDIPSGTHEGGLIGATVVAIIGITMITIIFVLKKYIGQKE